MEHIGIDVHKREGQICILTPEGEMIERRIQSTREKFTAMFGDRPPARVLVHHGGYGVLPEVPPSKGRGVQENLPGVLAQLPPEPPGQSPRKPPARRPPRWVPIPSPSGGISL